jgi:HAD superfamily hydrolase (TIGR01484 family)
MKSLNKFNTKNIQYIFTDIDDTLTHNGWLQKEAYDAIWKLQENGLSVIPVTGRPAGWCELIARQWPVKGVIGENGGFYFYYQNKTMKRRFVFDELERMENQKRLKKIEEEVLSSVAGAAVASDQFCRLMDLAIDFCEDVPPLSSENIEKIVSIFENHGAQAKVSSIHVNGWFGSYDKLSMCKIFCKDVLGFELSKNLHQCVFVGDSPNDEPMFEFFENSVGVANVKNFRLNSPPKFVTSLPQGLGFAELASHLLNQK